VGGVDGGDLPRAVGLGQRGLDLVDRCHKQLNQL
jgi:exonuclease VII small subunit